VEPTKGTKPATDTALDARDEQVPREKTRDTRAGTGAEGTPEAVYDDAIEEAVEDIHG